MFANGLNMVRAALYSISFLWLTYFQIYNSFSMKMKLRDALYLLLPHVFYFFNSVFNVSLLDIESDRSDNSSISLPTPIVVS